MDSISSIYSMLAAASSANVVEYGESVPLHRNVTTHLCSDRLVLMLVLYSMFSLNGDR